MTTEETISHKIMIYAEMRKPDRMNQFAVEEIIREELATLRAKAEAYDEGQTTNGVFSETTGKIVCVISTPTKDLAPGYTCRKVRVCEVVG